MKDFTFKWNDCTLKRSLKDIVVDVNQGVLQMPQDMKLYNEIEIQCKLPYSLSLQFAISHFKTIQMLYDFKLI